jgi:DNA-binding transcriptional ArsR family regulator
MIRIRFTVEDLSRVRVVRPVNYENETAFALENWHRNTGGYFRVWHHTVTSRVRRHAGTQQRLRRFSESGLTSRDLIGVPPGINTLSTSGPRQDRTGRIHELRRGELDALLEEFSRLAILPYRKAIQARLDHDTDAYQQIMSTSGVETLLRCLHPRIHWRAPFLEIEDNGPEDATEEVELDGRGLLVSPSLFLAAPGALLHLPTAGTEGPSPTLVFPVRPDPRTSSALTADADTTTQDAVPEDALAMLMGRTRAALLEELRKGCANVELAGRIGVSAAAVSQHTSVLRAAGLIATRRTRNLVLHTLTPLGRSLLSSGGSPRGHAVAMNSPRVPQT